MTMEKTAAQQAYLRFRKLADDEELRKQIIDRERQIEDLTSQLDPISKGKLIGTGVAGGLLGPVGGGIAGAINAPQGSGWASFGAGLGGGIVGGVPGMGLKILGMQTGNRGLMALGDVLGMLGSGAGAAGGYYLANKPESE